MSSTIVIILIVIAVLVVGLIAFLIIRRQRYVRALRGRHPKTRSNCSAISRSWGRSPRRSTREPRRPLGSQRRRRDSDSTAILTGS